MSYISIQAKLYSLTKQSKIRRNLSKKTSMIDETETNTNEKSYLTKEQYEKGMALSRKMRSLSTW